MRHLALLAAALLTACVVAPTPSTPTATQAAAPRLEFAGGAQQLATAQTRALAPLLRDEKGQAPAAGTIGWVSLATSVATVDPDGTVHGLAPGSATIVAALGANPAVRATINVQVTANASSVQLTVVPGTAKLAVAERTTLRGEVHLADGTVNGNVTWSTSDATVVAINPTTGEINGLKVGKATITAAYAQDQGVRGTAEIEVTQDKPDASPSTTVFRAGDLGEGWSKAVLSADTPGRAFAFADANVGLAVDLNGRIYSTISTGASWEPVAGSGLLGQSPVAIEMPDGQTAYAAAANRVYKSTDAGVSWTMLREFSDPNGSPTVVQLAFSSASGGYAVTAGGLLFKTSDGGATWGQAKTPDGLYFDGLALVGTKPWLLTKGAVYGYEGGSWVQGDVAIVPPTRTQVSFVSATQGFAATSQGVQATTDGGKTWAVVSQQGGSGELLAFSDALHGVRASNANAAYTTDGGKTWKNKALDNYTITEVRAAGPHDFYLLGHAIPHTNQPESAIFHYDGR